MLISGISRSLYLVTLCSQIIIVKKKKNKRNKKKKKWNIISWKFPWHIFSMVKISRILTSAWRLRCAWLLKLISIDLTFVQNNCNKCRAWCDVGEQEHSVASGSPRLDEWCEIIWTHHWRWQGLGVRGGGGGASCVTTFSLGPDRRVLCVR